MRPTRLFSIGILPLLLSACGQVSTYGSIAVEGRRAMNDLQAKATMITVCDIAVGSYYRVLTQNEQNYVASICSGRPVGADGTAMVSVPVQLVPAQLPALSAELATPHG